MKIRAVIIDDEELARKRLIKMLKQYENSIEIIGEACDGENAIEKISALKPDVIFLDVQMPGKDGFEVVRSIETQPLIIFTTAYNKYALKAFEENSIDYLLKPIERNGLERAINKLMRIVSEDRFRINENIEKVLTQLTNHKICRFKVRVGEKLYLIEAGEISYFEAKDKYTFLHTTDKEYIIDDTIAKLEEQLDPLQFLRIHRAIIVNVKFIKEMTKWFAGKYKIRLKDKLNTELISSRGYSGEISCL